MKNIKEQRGFLEIKNTYQNQKPNSKFGKHQGKLSGSKRKKRSRKWKRTIKLSTLKWLMLCIFYLNKLLFKGRNNWQYNLKIKG